MLDGTADGLFEGYGDGLNANMCEALLSLRDPSKDVHLELGVTFSKRLPGPPDLPRTVLIEDRGFELLVQAARVLRAADESTERELRGYIVKLAIHDTGYAHEDIDLADSREATLRFIEHGRRQHARMDLDPDDYKLACEAHRDGKEITVQGRLERTGKQWRISGVRDFGTLDRSTEIEKNRSAKLDRAPDSTS